MKDGIRNQLEGLDVERKRLEVLMASDPSWAAYREQADGQPTASVAAAAEIEQGLSADIVESLRSNRLYNAWRNLLVASDSLRELLGPDENDRPDAEPGENEGTEIGEGDEIRSSGPAAVSPTPEPAAFRTKLVVKSDQQPAESMGELIVSPSPSVEPHTPISQFVATNDITQSRPDNEALMREMSALLARRANAKNQLTTQLAVVSCEPTIENCAAEPEESAALVAVTEEPSQGSEAVEELPNELTRIRGVDPEDEEALRSIGFASYAQIAHMTAEQVKSLREVLPQSRRLSQEQWIEQAAILATGQPTSFVRRGHRNLADCLVEQPSNPTWQSQSLPLPLLPQPEQQPETEPAGEAQQPVGAEVETKAAKLAEDATSAPKPDIEELVSLLAIEAARRSAPSQPADTAEPASNLDAVPNPQDAPSTEADTAEPNDDNVSATELVAAPNTHVPDLDEPVDPNDGVETREADETDEPAEHVALSDRIERFERSMTQVALPDLRRPQPFEQQVDRLASRTEPSDPPSLPQSIVVEPPELIETADQAAEERPEIADFDWQSEPDDATWDEAAVEIVKVAPRETPPPAIAAGTVEQRTSQNDSHLNGQHLRQDPADEEVRIEADPTPYDLARRMETLARPTYDEDDQFIRFNGEIEEASVQIIRSNDGSAPPSQSEQQSSEQAVGPQSMNRSSPRASDTAPQTNRSARRFLDALTGSKKAR